MMSNTMDEFIPEGEMLLEGELEGDLERRYNNCPKNPGHKNFIPVNELDIEHFPEKFRTPDMMDYIRAQIDLTVLVRVAYTSLDRPDLFYNNGGSTLSPYPYSKQKGSERAIRYGTGSAAYISSRPFEDGNCPCHQCKRKQSANSGASALSSDGTSPKYWKIAMCTAPHVIYDDSESKRSQFTFFYDTDDKRSGTVKTLHGLNCAEIVYPDESYRSDMNNYTICATHDSQLASKITGLLNNQTKTKLQFVHDLVEPLDAFIISHPHGCSKRITFGKIKYLTIPLEIYGNNHTDNSKPLPELSTCIVPPLVETPSTTAASCNAVCSMIEKDTLYKNTDEVVGAEKEEEESEIKGVDENVRIMIEENIVPPLVETPSTTAASCNAVCSMIEKDTLYKNTDEVVGAEKEEEESEIKGVDENVRIMIEENIVPPLVETPSTTAAGCNAVCSMVEKDKVYYKNTDEVVGAEKEEEESEIKGVDENVRIMIEENIVPPLVETPSTTAASCNAVCSMIEKDTLYKNTDEVVGAEKEEEESEIKGVDENVRIMIEENIVPPLVETPSTTAASCNAVCSMVEKDKVYYKNTDEVVGAEKEEESEIKGADKTVSLATEENNNCNSKDNYEEVEGEQQKENDIKNTNENYVCLNVGTEGQNEWRKDKNNDEGVCQITGLIDGKEVDTFNDEAGCVTTKLEEEEENKATSYGAVGANAELENKETENKGEKPIKPFMDLGYLAKLKEDNFDDNPFLKQLTQSIISYSEQRNKINYTTPTTTITPDSSVLLPNGTIYTLPSDAEYCMKYYTERGGKFKFPPGTKFTSPDGKNISIPNEAEFESVVYFPQHYSAVYDIDTCGGSSGATVFIDCVDIEYVLTHSGAWANENHSGTYNQHYKRCLTQIARNLQGPGCYEHLCRHQHLPAAPVSQRMEDEYWETLESSRRSETDDEVQCTSDSTS